MKTGFALTQWTSFLRMSVREPLRSARTNIRLAGRALTFLAENPDLLRIRSLLDPDMPLLEPGNTALIITSNGVPRFSFALTSQGKGNLSQDVMEKLLDNVRHRGFAGDARLLVVEETVFARVREAFAGAPEGDPFYLAAVSLWNCFREGLIEFHPSLAQTELAKALLPEDVLSRFGPRFGLYPQGRNPVHRLIRAPGRYFPAG